MKGDSVSKNHNTLGIPNEMKIGTLARSSPKNKIMYTNNILYSSSFPPNVFIDSVNCNNISINNSTPDTGREIYTV